MIAIFCKKEDVQYIRLRPKNLFVFVKDINDIRDIEFSAVITFGNTWYYDSNKDYAYSELVRKFPKLKP